MEIEEIRRFKTNDGSVFNYLADAEKYNILLGKCDDIENSLISRPDDTDFTNGVGWIKHDIFTKQKLGKEILELFHEHYPGNESITQMGYIIGRMLDDNNIKCLNHLMYRWQCIHEDKEYGQPYYADNPDKVTGEAIN